MGVVEAEEIKKIAELPEEKTVAALITFVVPGESPEKTPRKSVEEIAHFKKGY